MQNILRHLEESCANRLDNLENMSKFQHINQSRLKYEERKSLTVNKEIESVIKHLIKRKAQDLMMTSLWNSMNFLKKN